MITDTELLRAAFRGLSDEESDENDLPDAIDDPGLDEEEEESEDGDGWSGDGTEKEEPGSGEEFQ